MTTFATRGAAATPWRPRAGYWIHYIASLKYSIQCNTRSGSPPNGEGEEDIEKCMGGGNIQPNARGGGKPKKKKKLRGAAGFPMVPPGAAQKDH